MEVEQKHITTIRMHDAKGGDVTVVKDGGEYRLQLTSSNRAVVITLGHQDLRRLCQQLVQLDIDENWKADYVRPPEVKSFFLNNGLRGHHDSLSSWFVRMAGEMNEKAGRNS